MMTDKAAAIRTRAATACRLVIARSSDANERLDHAAEEAGQPDIALHRDQTDADLAIVDHRVMGVFLIGVVAIAGTITAAVVDEGALEHAGQFGAGVAVRRNLKTA